MNPRPRLRSASHPAIPHAPRTLLLALVLMLVTLIDLNRADDAAQAHTVSTVRHPRAGDGEFQQVQVDTDTSASTTGSVTDLLLTPANWDRLDLDAAQRVAVSNLVREVQRERNRVVETRAGRKQEWQQSRERFATASTEAKQELQKLGDGFVALLNSSQRQVLQSERERDRRAASSSSANVPGSDAGGNVGGGGGVNGGPAVEGSTRWRSAQGATSSGSGGIHQTFASYQSGGEPGSVVRAVRNTKVVARLGLRPEQREHLQGLLARAQEIDDRQLQALGVPPLGRPEWRNEQKSLKQLQSRTDETLLAALRPAQRVRLRGLQLQFRGVLDPLLEQDLQTTLSFRPEQAATLAQWHAEFERRNPLFPESLLPTVPGAPPKPAAAAAVAAPVSPEQYQARRAALARRVVQELLSAEQYRRYAELRGQPIVGCETLPPRKP